MRIQQRRVLRNIHWSFVAAATVACGGSTPEPAVDTGSPAQQQQQQQTVATIVGVQCTVTKSPPRLEVTANGEVPTGGWTGAALKRRVFVSAPTDGVWEYDFVAMPPRGMATQVITPITAEDTWADYPSQSLVGVRVYGEGSGIKEIRLTDCTAQ